ncbi:hypothetical protein RHCRD62_40207 [Rhodococcus sp. RD6.2]|nr:hypothetical protein RHCRD62_40207 [Rhodococcus sp. RD6.2]
MGVPRCRSVVGRAWHQHARHRSPLLRHLRDVRRQVHGGRGDRAAVLRRAAASARTGSGVAARPERQERVAGATQGVHGDVPVEDPRRVVGDLPRHRRLRVSGPDVRRGPGERAPRGPRHARRARRRRPAPSRTAVLPHQPGPAVRARDREHGPRYPLALIDPARLRMPGIRRRAAVPPTTTSLVVGDPHHRCPRRLHWTHPRSRSATARGARWAGCTDALVAGPALAWFHA